MMNGGYAKAPSCPFCGSGSAKFWFDHLSDRDRKTYPIHKCGSCKSAFVHPQPTSELLNEYYSSTASASYQHLVNRSTHDRLAEVLRAEAEFPNATVDAERMAATLKDLGAGLRLLDAGAGCGFFTRAAVSHGFEVTAIELSETSRNVFRQLNSFDALDQAFDDGFAAEYAGRFDVVLLSQVLEHLPIASKPVDNIRRLLAPNGICAIAVPHFTSSISILQGRRDMFICPPEHLNFFTVKGLDALFQANGFNALKHETISRFNKSKMYSKLRPRIFADMVVGLLPPFLNASDSLGKGMFINSYFRKGTGHSRDLPAPLAV